MECYFNFTQPTKIPSKQSFVLGWNLGNNQQIIGKLRHFDNNSAAIQHFIAIHNQHRKTILKECIGCSIHNPHTVISSTVNTPHNSCFTNLPLDLCFTIP
ncbi:10600_t:CDS:1, partial [Funneliformis geosporum]